MVAMDPRARRAAAAAADEVPPAAAFWAAPRSPPGSRSPPERADGPADSSDSSGLRDKGRAGTQIRSDAVGLYGPTTTANTLACRKYKRNVVSHLTLIDYLTPLHSCCSELHLMMHRTQRRDGCEAPRGDDWTGLPQQPCRLGKKMIRLVEAMPLRAEKTGIDRSSSAREAVPRQLLHSQGAHEGVGKRLRAAASRSSADDG